MDADFFEGDTCKPDAITSVWARRVAASQLCIDKFVGKPYRPGKMDCLRLLATDLKALGQRAPLSKVRPYSSEKGAIRAMKEAGFSSLLEVVDSLDKVRIPPASAWPGDIVALPAEGGSAFGCALAIAVGNGRVVGFYEGVGAVVQPHEYLTAWRAC